MCICTYSDIQTYINGDGGTYEEKVCSYGKEIEIVVSAEITFHEIY